jgi:hypothetical protein
MAGKARIAFPRPFRRRIEIDTRFSHKGAVHGAGLERQLMTQRASRTFPLTRGLRTSLEDGTKLSEIIEIRRELA